MKIFFLHFHKIIDRKDKFPSDFPELLSLSTEYDFEEAMKISKDNSFDALL